MQWVYLGEVLCSPIYSQNVLSSASTILFPMMLLCSRHHTAPAIFLISDFIICKEAARVYFFLLCSAFYSNHRGKSCIGGAEIFFILIEKSHCIFTIYENLCILLTILQLLFDCRTVFRFMAVRDAIFVVE